MTIVSVIIYSQIDKESPSLLVVEGRGEETDFSDKISTADVCHS